MDTARQGSDINQVWWTADEQLAGRGRRGRHWVSPPGNMYGSVGLIDIAPSQALGTLPLVAALAAHYAITELLPPDIRPLCQIKWPNDILINKSKCAGLLLESFATNGKMGVVLGFGINCAHAPSDTLYPATTLAAQGATIAPDMLWRGLASALSKHLEVWDKGRNFAEIRRLWLSAAAGIGQPVTVNLANSSKSGIFEAIDGEGFLLLNTSYNTTERISAGDVFFQH